MNLAARQLDRRFQPAVGNSANRVNRPQFASTNRPTIGQQLARFGNGRTGKRLESSAARATLAGIDTDPVDPFGNDGSPTGTVANNILRDEANGAATAMRNFFAAMSQAAVKTFTNLIPDKFPGVGSAIDSLIDQQVKDMTGTDNPLLEPGTPVSLPSPNAPSFDSGSDTSSGDNSQQPQPQPLPVPPLPIDSSVTDPGPAMQDPSLDSPVSGANQDQTADPSQSDSGTSMLP